MISIIIRTKNEERWITSCLKAVFNQKETNFEVILVDNESTDKTILKAKQFNINKIVKVNDYLPGKALNVGIKESVGDYIVCLSGHCIPVSDMWLTNLFDNFNNDDIAGVYGRQEPLSFTTDFDKRDLNIVFGLDKKIQVKDSFFHNANSMIRREVLEKIPFDEKVTNIEDRVWAQEILKDGYKIAYEPEASVYHYHGIHQNLDSERCFNVVKILEKINIEKVGEKYLDLDNLNIVAIIPQKGDIAYLNNKPIIEYTIDAAKESKYINQVVVSTDNPDIKNLSENLGAFAPFLRDKSLSEDFIDIEKVYQYTLEKLEELNVFPDLVVSLEVTFPFREKGVIDNMILNIVKNGLDSITSVKSENKSILKEKKGEIIQLDEGMTPRKFKDPTFIELRGVCMVTHPEFIRTGNLYGPKTGIYEVENPFSWIEIRDKKELGIAELLMPDWDASNKKLKV